MTNTPIASKSLSWPVSIFPITIHTKAIVVTQQNHFIFYLSGIFFVKFLISFNHIGQLALR